MGDIIDIAAYLPHKVSEVICVKCGVYIKGMEMPKAHPLTVTIYPDGQVLSETVGAKDKHGIAVPVPPHGRLIDADALRQSIGESIDECHKWANEIEGGEMYARVSQSLGTFVECSLRVKVAPTIIPADSEKEAANV